MNIQLWDHEIPAFCPDAETPNQMVLYLINDQQTRPCIVIYPGGGYGEIAPHEGKPIAKFFNEAGFHAVVVNYRVAPNRFPAPLADAQRAIRLVRAHANEWNIDPQKIITCGFSAGGHLCASTILYDDVYSNLYHADEIDSYSCIPNGAILCYPVISVESDYGHIGSGQRLLGERYELEKKEFSLSQYIKESTPPVFLWHTSDDAVVNVKNSLIFGEHLRDNGIPFELHVFPHGHHGLGLSPKIPEVAQWTKLAVDWIKRTFEN